MPTLTWKDYRLPMKDIVPWDTIVMYVSKGMPLAELVSDTVSWARSNWEKGDLYLMIYCHGLSGQLQICNQGIALKNVTELEPLSPYFDGVSIHACLVAKGDKGRAFCTKLAQVMVAPVTGAVGLQYNTGPQMAYGFLDDRKYDGDYYIHDTAGSRTGPFRSP
jgi:hypothetical protein